MTSTARSPDALEDSELLGRLAAGDREALTGIYRRHAAEAFAVAHPLCGRAAGDIVDAACLELWRQARAGRDVDEPVRSRLLRITRQQARDRIHRGHDCVHGRPALSSDPSASLIALSDADVRTLLQAIPVVERGCVELAYLEGLSVAEIAQRMRMPCAAVGDHLERGTGRVRRRLSEGAGTRPPSAAR